MNILAVNLQRSSAINVAVYGNFSGPKQQEIAVAKGSFIELLRPDDTGKVISICSTPVFAVIRTLLAFRLSGSNRDYVVIGSDSGKISIVEFDSKKNEWKLVHCEVFGKTGCRRIVPGQYIAADPKGRAILIGGIEKQKFVYIMNRDSSNNLTISSPLEAHKNETILFSCVGVDMGFDNPIFAMIELEYTEADQDPSGEAAQEAEKKLTYYELDLGLNHVVRKWSEPVSRTANFLLAVPGGDAWPSGVLICGENWISYKHQGHVEIRTALPRRADLPLERGVLITTGTVHKQKDLFFFLLQSEYGDLYKVTLDLNPADTKQVTNVIVTVFDTIHPCNSLCITKTGLFFAASEFGNHNLFQFQGIDDPNAVRSERVSDELNEELGDDSESAAQVAPTFVPSTRLSNLLITDELESLAPITDMLVDDLSTQDGEASSQQQIYTVCGRGHRSSLRILRRGVSITEMAVSELPGRPTAVWTVKKTLGDDFDRYIVVSFSNATLVLSIGDNVEEITDSGFLTNAATLQVVLLADNALIQVHNNGIRHIRPDQRTSEWKAPGRRLVQLASANSRQVAISLTGGEITYFELDATGQLVEMGAVDMGKEVCSLDIGEVPEGRSRSQFLAVGCWDDTVQLLSLDPSDVLGKGPSFGVESRPTSLCLLEMTKEKALDQNSSDSAPIRSLYLNVGLEKGVLLRVAVDMITGDFSDARQKFLGPKAIKLCRVKLQGETSVMALTSRAWLLYNYQNRYHQDPVSYEALEYAHDFASEACPDGIVVVAGNTLRIVTVDNLGTMFNQSTIPLRYTPRKICRVPNSNQLVVIESDINEYSEADKAKLAEKPYDPEQDSSVEMAEEKAASGGEEDDDEEGTKISIRGAIPPTDGHWASCIRVIDPTVKNDDGTSGGLLSLLELKDNEAAFSVCTCQFAQHSEETFIVVGTIRGLTLHPKKWQSCFIHVYRLLPGSLQLLHQTEIEDLPLAMVQFQGRLLVGVGRCLRLFDLGKRKLLKKCENRLFPTSIVRLQCSGDRIFVGDQVESVHFVKYRRHENVLSIFADDSSPRFVTSLTVLDYASVACVDKFGNFFILRLGDDVNEDAEGGSSAGGGTARLMWDQGFLNGAPNKLDTVCNYYLGEAATCITKCTFKMQGKDVLLVSTVSGGLIAMVPIISKEDGVFFQHLEMYLRQEFGNLVQRDHLSFRSYFGPVKAVMDGELCERYTALPLSKQKDFATDADRTPTEVIKKLEELRDFI